MSPAWRRPAERVSFTVRREWKPAAQQQNMIVPVFALMSGPDGGLGIPSIERHGHLLLGTPMPEKTPSYLVVKDWAQYQHYKNRNPPWIKLYYHTLDDYEFARLSDVAKGHLLLIWLLASRHGGRIHNDPVWVGRRIGATDPINLQVLIDQGFLLTEQDASNMLAECKQSAMPEREKRERRKEGDEEEDETAASPTFGRVGEAQELEPQVSQGGFWGSYIALVRELWWQPDGKPPEGWDESREASIYRQRRAKGDTHLDLLDMVRGIRLMLDRGILSWVQGKPTSRLLNNTADGARNLGTLALEAYQTHGEAPPRAIRTSTSGMTSIGSLLPYGLPVTSSYTTAAW